jgi:flagellar export protein FliJ
LPKSSVIEGVVKAATTLAKLAERRADEAVSVWRRLQAQCEDARQKLDLLQRHGEKYRDLMRAGLQRGMPATSIAACLGFIGQIEAVVGHQQSELVQLEEACARQWQELVTLRRERRMFEILGERAAAEAAATEGQRQRREIEEALACAARTWSPISHTLKFDD